MASKQTTTPSDLTDATAVDAAVLAGCRAGERGAQQRLCELRNRQVYRLMVRMVGLQTESSTTRIAAAPCRTGLGAVT